jgi:uncharacterized short protein YbdD (DUF466 family)
VVSMAMSLVGSAIRVASSASSQEMSMLIGVQNEIWYILWMQLPHPSSSS